MPIDSVSPTRPRWLRLNVRLRMRTLLVLVLALGGGLGWVVHRARVQRDAVAAIRRVGGGVAFDWQRASVRPGSAPPTAPGPDWLRRALGPDFLDTATYVRLNGEPCQDESLRAACRLPWLEELIVLNTGATDAGAEDLRRLKNLRTLDLRLNRMTPRPLRHIGDMTELRELKLAMRLSPVPLRDEDLAFLSRLTKLERLMIPSKDLTDAWLPYIERLRNLESLELYDMAITTKGLDHLQGLSNLRVLSLHGSRITGLEPLRPLAKLSSLCVAYTPVGDSALACARDWPLLYRLDLRKTNITDAGLIDLAELPALRELDLSQTGVTDAGLRHLAGSKSLRSVIARGTAITDTGIEEFSKVNPTVAVTR